MPLPSAPRAYEGTLACYLESVGNLLLPALVLPAIVIFAVALARVSSVVHLHCRILLATWLIALSAIACAQLAFPFWLASDGRACLPLTPSTPRGFDDVFAVMLAGYMLSTFAELLIAAERFVACQLLERYRATPASVLLLAVVVLVVSAVAVQMGRLNVRMGALAAEDPQHFDPLNFFVMLATDTILDISAIAANLAVGWYGKKRYGSTRGAVLNARYTLSEVLQLNRCLKAIMLLSGVMKCAAMLGGVTYAINVYNAALTSAPPPPFHGHIFFFTSMHTINCGLCVWLFMLRHRRLRKDVFQWLPILKSCVRSRKLDATASPRTTCYVETDKHFEMLKKTWA